MRPPPFGPPLQEGQNGCWEWMKQEGCYDHLADRALTWLEAQERVAGEGKAPWQAEAPINPLRNPWLCDQRELGQPLSVGRREIGAATVWLRDNIAVYVLNLRRDTLRLSEISDRLAVLGIAFERVEGVDLTVPEVVERAVRDGMVPRSFDFTQLGVLGTAGCAAAHLDTMRHIMTRLQHQPVALVLEDDVKLELDFAVRLQRLLESEAPCDWAVISLKSLCPYGQCVAPHLTRVQPDGNEPAESCRRGVNFGFFAMLYNIGALPDVRTRLTEAVWQPGRPECLNVDVALASISDQIPYYAVPHVQNPGFFTMQNTASSRMTANAY